MMHTGEMISLIVAILWTFSAWFADKSSRLLGSMVTNVLRLVLASLFLSLIVGAACGKPYPAYADSATWLWLSLSALVGYVFGDFCLFNCYLSIGPRYGQLLMTLAPPLSAITAWLLLGESLSLQSILAVCVTICGICLSILSRGSDRHIHLNLPLKGILLGIGAAVGQGVGLVLSKIGMMHYEAALPADAAARWNEMIPFAATLIRALVGAAGFLLLLGIQKQFGHLKAAFGNPRGMRYAMLLTLFGPVLGVSLSLMAVQYAPAGIASTLMALVPVLIVIPDALFNHHRITPKEILGLAVTMSGVALFFL